MERADDAPPAAPARGRPPTIPRRTSLRTSISRPCGGSSCRISASWLRDLRDLHQRESTIESKAEAVRRELSEKQVQLEKLAATLAEQKRDIEDRDREQDEHHRKVVLREAEVRLEQAELHEMQQIAEQEVSHERAQLTQERLRIARLREMLRMEQAAFHAAVERYSDVLDSPPGS